jgi:bacillolysin
MKYIFNFLLIMTFASIVAKAQTSFAEKEKTATPSAKPTFQYNRIIGSPLQTSPHFSYNKSIMSPLEKTAPISPNAGLKNTFTIVRSTATNLPIFIQRNGGSPMQLRAPLVNSTQIVVSNYLDLLSTTLELQNASQQFKITKTDTDPLGGLTIRLQQQFNNVDIENCESIIHINASGIAVSWNGLYIKPEMIRNKNFNITSTTAVLKALVDLNTQQDVIEMSEDEKHLLDYTTPEVKQVFYIDQKLIATCVPAYIVQIRPNFIEWFEYVVDAQTGNILSSHSKTCHIDGPETSTGADLNGIQQTINTYKYGSLFYTVDATRSMFSASQSNFPDNPVGAIQTLDLNYTWGATTRFRSISSLSNTFSATAISAHYIAGKSYEYYKNIHNRNSIDGNGGTIISFINVADPNSGAPMDNAYWNGRAMYYGNGNTAFKPLAGGLDVGGHELTHGVIQNTANLMYQGESGAINESMADIFGCMIDPSNWTIGEDVVLLSQYPSGALRDLSDPHNGGVNINSRGWQPKHVSEKYIGSSDNGGVHINSGIPNYAFYLLAQSTLRTSAEKIFYRALTTYLVRSSQFIDLRIACIQAASDIFGANSTETTQTGLAFDQVGILSTSGTPVVIQENDYAINPGAEYLLGYNLNTSISQKLFRITTSSNTISTINTTSAFNKTSVTDNGDVAYFVNSSNQITKTFLTPGNTLQTIIEPSHIWNNVAVSKNGRHLAATTIDSDTAIYVYDFATDVWSKFTLYSPTFSNGIQSGGPIYADVLEWDHTGQYLIYDCYNEFKNNSGNDISFWDINFIDVWDNTINDIGDGTITKLFPSIAEDISIGNPTFSKNSAHIIAFDYIDQSAGEVLIMGCNIETNEMHEITYSNALGYPSFSKDDDKIAYVYNISTSPSSSPNTKSIWIVELNGDKISALPGGQDAWLIKNSKWPVYYANGARWLPTSIKTNTKQTGSNSVTIYPNPTTSNVQLKFNSTIASQATITITSILGVRLQSISSLLSVGENTIPISLPNNLADGCYIISIESETNRWSGRFIKK